MRFVLRPVIFYLESLVFRYIPLARGVGGGKIFNVLRLSCSQEVYREQLMRTVLEKAQLASLRYNSWISVSSFFGGVGSFQTCCTLAIHLRALRLLNVKCTPLVVVLSCEDGGRSICWQQTHFKVTPTLTLTLNTSNVPTQKQAWRKDRARVCATQTTEDDPGNNDLGCRYNIDTTVILQCVMRLHFSVFCVILRTHCESASNQ